MQASNAENCGEKVTGQVTVMGRRKKRRGECVYCGQEGKLTREHVPARSFFGPTPKHKLISVPACRPCNEGAAKDDEYLRSALLCRDDTKDHEVVRERLPSVARALENPAAQGFAKGFAGSVSVKDAYTPAGLWVGQAAVFDADSTRVGRTIARYIKGLIYHHNGRRLPDDYLVKAFAIEALPKLGPDADSAMRQVITATLSTPMRPEIGGAVRYRYAPINGDPFQSCWIIRFYDAATFVGFTSHKDLCQAA